MMITCYRQQHAARTTMPQSGTSWDRLHHNLTSLIFSYSNYKIDLITMNSSARLKTKRKQQDRPISNHKQNWGVIMYTIIVYIYISLNKNLYTAIKNTCVRRNQKEQLLINKYVGKH